MKPAVWRAGMQRLCHLPDQACQGEGETSAARHDFPGAMPFLLAMIVALLLIIIFPQIALFLPNSMFG
ncbi:hypothetical protein REJC140_01346 [Pseudorhizobium endolithicum]|uniref:Uncharacterized protein n=1 Tax=Pseudorhizobium endolithicum TaxID=1191678 RepID=A0ABN7JWM1_9HYPH|nr:hypothetical protein REJC140_01346 [Pseudorhizobium endolithicum]